MPLIFGDDRFDFGKLPDLMSQRLDIDAGEQFATTAACVGNAGDDLATASG